MPINQNDSETTPEEEAAERAWFAQWNGYNVNPFLLERNENE